MKRPLVVFLSIIVSMSLTSTPANAAKVNLKIGNWFTGTVENTLTYKGADCRTMKISYKIDRGLDWPYHFVSLSLDQKSKTELAYATIKPGDDDPYKGTKEIKICQTTQEVLVDEDCDPEFEAEYGSECEYETVGGIKPGTYTLSATLTQLKPFLMKKSNKVVITIKK